MQASKNIKSIMNELKISISGLAVLVDVNPATIHRWLNNDVEMSEENSLHLEEVRKIINNLAKTAKCSSKEITKSLVELKKSPFWQGWEHAAKMLGGIELSLHNENYLKKHLIQNPELIKDGLRHIKRISSGLDVDALFKDEKGAIVAIKCYKKSVTSDEYGKVKNLLTKISEKIGNKYTLVLAAPRFAPMFQEISSDKKNLKMFEYNFTTKEVKAVGLF